MGAHRLVQVVTVAPWTGRRLCPLPRASTVLRSAATAFRKGASRPRPRLYCRRFPGRSARHLHSVLRGANGRVTLLHNRRRGRRRLVDAHHQRSPGAYSPGKGPAAPPMDDAEFCLRHYLSRGTRDHWSHRLGKVRGGHRLGVRRRGGPYCGLGPTMAGTSPHEGDPCRGQPSGGLEPTFTYTSRRLRSALPR